MGDRTTVRITLHQGDYEKHKEHIKTCGANSTDPHGDNLITLEAYEVNYAEWSELENYLQEHKVEYDKEWEAGGDYEAGNAYYRMIGNKYKSYDIYDSQKTVLEVLLDMKERIEKDPKKALNYIEKELKKLHPFDARNLDQPNSSRFIKEA